jgi:predicted dehydrogenase
MKTNSLVRSLRQVVAVLALISLVSQGLSAAEKQFCVGIIGCDTSHVPAMAKSISEQVAADGRPMRVVAAYPGGSDDMPVSRDRVKGFTEGLAKQGVRIVNSVEELLPLVDAVLLESVDGRKHLEQARPAFAAGKPVFIDKPVAASLADTLEIYRLAEETKTPCFSSSSLRFAPETAELTAASKGATQSCDAYGPCHHQVGHPDLFWYGIHTVEMLFTVMGSGCETVARTQTPDVEFVVGVWKDGRIGTVRASYKGPARYGVTIFDEKGPEAIAATPGERALTAQIAEFFRTGKSPVSAEETIEIVTFMEAADESKRQGGKPVRLSEVRKMAEKTAAER